MVVLQLAVMEVWQAEALSVKTRTRAYDKGTEYSDAFPLHCKP